MKERQYQYGLTQFCTTAKDKPLGKIKRMAGTLMWVGVAYVLIRMVVWASAGFPIVVVQP